MRGRWIAAIAAGVVLLIGGSSVVASAASVGPVASRLFAASAPVTYTAADRQVTDVARTTSGSPAVITALSITVTGPTLSGLNGQAVSVVLVDSSNAVVTTVTGTVATGTGGNTVVGASSAIISLPVTGSPSATTVTGWATFLAGVQLLGPTATTPRAVTIGNGTFPVTTWQQTLVPQSNPATNVTGVTVVVSNTVTQCLTISITGKTSTPTAWSIQLNYGAGPYWGVAPAIQRAVVQSTTGTVMTLVGTSNPGAPWDGYSNNSLVTNTQTVDISVCQNNAGIAPDRPEAYTVSNVVASGTWSSSEACKSVTVTGNGVYPFPFGWKVTIDMADAVAYLKAADSAAPRAMQYTPDIISPAFSSTTTSYTVSNYRDDEVSGTASQVVKLCLERY